MIPDWDRKLLRERVELRVDRMLEDGWLEEVRGLKDRGIQGALGVVGYRQLAAQLAGELDAAQARMAIVTAHWRYAKQQLTWFKAQADFRWLPTPVDTDALEKDLRDFLSSTGS